MATLEYRFPLTAVNKGWGVVPLFLKRFHGGVVADGAQVNGYGYDQVAKLYVPVANNRLYYSGGVELKMDLTVGYHFPFTFYAGMYWPAPNDRNHKQTQFVIGTVL